MNQSEWERENFITRQPPIGGNNDYDTLDSENSWISEGLSSSSRRRSRRKRRGDGGRGREKASAGEVNVGVDSAKSEIKVERRRVPLSWTDIDSPLGQKSRKGGLPECGENELARGYGSKPGLYNSLVEKFVVGVRNNQIFKVTTLRFKSGVFFGVGSNLQLSRKWIIFVN